MVVSNQPASQSIGRVRTRYFGWVRNSFAASSINSFPVGGSEAVGTCQVWFQAPSVSASRTRALAASGVKVSECFTESFISHIAFAPLANLSKTNLLGTPFSTLGP